MLHDNRKTNSNSQITAKFNTLYCKECTKKNNGSFLTSVHFFKDEVETVGLFEVFDELNYIFVTLAMVERLDLLQHTRPTKWEDIREGCILVLIV